ncbi:hypothetical protein FJY68_12085 [candidate division WOR-3 bacterium]|uniref:Uncharacterized protein n=1 Tax=candidate division WOR-3 bacterium TaxID=2052148 RepID=A0A938BU33_UNCW3|nr:hypothetical protein [candidate division WOR-3 bacterium]
MLPNDPRLPTKLDPWKIIDRLESIRADEPIPAEIIRAVADELSTWADRRCAEVIAALEKAHENKWADGLAGAWREHRDRLYSTYFSLRCFSFELGTGQDSLLDGRRASIVFHASHELHRYLMGYLSGLPDAKVMNAERRRDAAAFGRAHKQAYLDSLASILKTVEHDLDVFSRVTEQFVSGSAEGPVTFRSPSWQYDFEFAAEGILLGLLPTGDPASINSGMPPSPVAGASVVRGHLESVLFRRDFLAALHGAREPSCGRSYDAVRALKENGLLIGEEGSWASNAYGLLSEVHHSGAFLTTGEVFMLSQLTRELQKLIDSRHQAKQENEHT